MAKSNVAEIGHNSEDRTEQIQDLVIEYVDTRRQSQELNDTRKVIREKADKIGIDPGAFQDQVRRAEKDLKKRDGYDESAKEVADAIGQMDPEELWAYVFERAEKKNQERAEKKAEKDAAREQKAIEKAEKKAAKEAA